MNSLIANNYVTEMTYGANFAYVLNDNSMFLSTEYKVLQSQTDSCFVKCMKMLYNGKIQLYYLTKAYKPFAAMIPTIDSDSFMKIVANLISDIIDVKHNGFLSCQNIDISFERIYVDPTTYKVSLVYLPTSKRIYADVASFENEVRTGLVKLISGIEALSAAKTIQLAADLANGSLSMEDLHNRVMSNSTAEVAKTAREQCSDEKRSTLQITAMNAPERVEIEVTKDEFVIGRKVELCDGVVSFNKMIGRAHCKICRVGSQYRIIDLQSTNHTYVNGVRLQPNQSYPIKAGDIIRLADSDFKVSMV